MADRCRLSSHMSKRGREAQGWTAIGTLGSLPGGTGDLILEGNDMPKCTVQIADDGRTRL